MLDRGRYELFAPPESWEERHGLAFNRRGWDRIAPGEEWHEIPERMPDREVIAVLDEDSAALYEEAVCQLNASRSYLFSDCLRIREKSVMLDDWIAILEKCAGHGDSLIEPCAEKVRQVMKEIREEVAKIKID